jgi:hypothetical protein
MFQGPRMNPRGIQQQFIGPGFQGRQGMHTRQMYPGSFGPMPRMQQRQLRPMGGQGPQRNQGGGLLAKIMGKGGGRGQRSPGNGLLSAGSGPARAAAGSGGGFLKTLTDPATLNGFLTNTQKMLSTAQQFGPMIQQYGPIVRNLPSMWKLYRGLKDLPDADEQTSDSSNKESDMAKGAESNKKPIKKKTSAKKKKEASDNKKNQNPKVSSSPKLFI